MFEILSLLRGIIFKFIHRNHNNIVVQWGLKLNCWLLIKGPGRVEIGENCIISSLAGSRIQLVTLFTHSSDAKITIGNNVQLIAAKISSKFAISIGNNVIIEDASILDTDFHTLDIARQTPQNENLETCQVVIEDNVHVGARSIITKGVTVGRASCVYPGSVVHRSIPSHSSVIGNPAKLIRKKLVSVHEKKIL